MTRPTSASTSAGAAADTASGISASLLPAIIAGSIGGLMTLSASIAYPAVVFAGPMAAHLGLGITLSLFTSAVLGAIIAWRSTYPAAIAHTQIETAVVLGAVAVIVADTLAAAPDAVGLATLLVVIATGTILLGVVFILLGAFRLGNAVRYIPFPVIGGFLAYIAWLLAKGGLATMVGEPLTPATVATLFDPAMLLLWLPGALLAMALLVLQFRRRHHLNMPLMLLGALGLFWLVAWLGDTSVASLEAAGYVLAPLQREQAWSPFMLAEALALVDWWLVLGLLPRLAVVAVVALITLLLTASTLEVASRRPVDLNKELIVTGCGNLAAGLGGGLPGYHSVSASLLPHYLGTRSRLVGLIGAAMCAGTLLFGGPLLAYVPKLLIGLVLIYLALDIAAELALDRWPRLLTADRGVMVLVFLSLIWFGFVEGIVIGIVAGLSLFAVSYASIGAVRASGNGGGYSSNVLRPPGQLALLAERADAIQVVQLQGYLFFGTAHRLLGEIATRIEAPGDVPRRFLILDFARVSGVDSSTIDCFVRLFERADEQGCDVLVANLPETLATVLHIARGGVPLQAFADLDHSLEHAEDVLLADSADDAGSVTAITSELARVFADSAQLARLRDYASPITWRAGDHIIRQGDPSDCMFFIESGRLTARLERSDASNIRLRTIMAGTVVGEVGCYLGGPRSASIVAETDGSAFKLTLADLERMRTDDAELAADMHAFLARLAVERLAHNTRLLQHF